MRRITSFRDLCSRVKGRVERYFINPIYKRKEENHGSKGILAIQVTYCKVGNLGDTVLSQCVRKTLEKLCGITSYNIIAVNAPVTEKTVDLINNSDVLIIGGGGLFLPDTNENAISGWQWAIPNELLEKIQVPIVLYTIGYNYFRGQKNNELFEKNVRLLASKCSFIGLRNNGSCRAINELIGGGKNKAVYQPCTTTLIRRVYANLAEKKPTGNIALNVAFDRENLRYGDDQELILTQIALAMKELVERGYKLNYVSHCESDKRFIPYLENENVAFKDVNMSDWFPRKAIDFYNEIDCVLGMRGHTQMIPFGLNCEIISLGSHEKMRWFLEDIDAQDWYIELRENPRTLKERIVETFTRIHEKEPERTKERLLEAQGRLWKITIQNAKLIEKIATKGNVGAKE